MEARTGKPLPSFCVWGVINLCGGDLTRLPGLFWI
jgi:hypothetical protein